MDPDSERAPLLPPTQSELSRLPIYPLIHRIRKDIRSNIDSPLDWDQISAPDFYFSILEPLLLSYGGKNANLSIIYCLLANRVKFLSDEGQSLYFASINSTRASVCELLAIKLLRSFSDDGMRLVSALTSPWHPFAGAPPDVRQRVHDENWGAEAGNALEMAIVSEAKRFTKSPLVQRVVDEIWAGRVVIAATSSKAIISDTYKRRPTMLYDSKNASWLNHQRLRVPRYRAVLEALNFLALFVLFVLCLANRENEKTNIWECLFNIFMAGFLLDEFAAVQERGFDVYIANTWNSFDSCIIVIWTVYLFFRVHGLVVGGDKGWAWSETGFDTLSCASIVLFPRLAFFAVSNNVITLCLRQMLRELFFFLTLAVISFSGFAFCLVQLGREKWSLRGVVWLMIQIWFGNSSLSFSQANSFHPIFGPILLVLFAALCSFLLLTILISILSNTFAEISANATEELLFQCTVSTLESTSKTDALFSYQPPLNLVAYAVLLPASWVLSPRRFHSLNVFLTRVLGAPVLITIALYERYGSPTALLDNGRDAARRLFDRLPRQVTSTTLFGVLLGSGTEEVLEAIFDSHPDEDSDLDLFDSSDSEADTVSFSGLPPTSPRRGRPTDDEDAPVPSRAPSRARSSASRKRRSAVFEDASGASARSPAKANGLFGSPIARLFGRPVGVSQQPEPADRVRIAAAPTRAELAEKKERDAEVVQLREELQALNERSKRMESILLSMSRSMRGESAA